MVVTLNFFTIAVLNWGLKLQKINHPMAITLNLYYSCVKFEVLDPLRLI